MTDRSKPPEGYRLQEVEAGGITGYVGRAKIQTGGSRAQAIAACWAHAEAQREIGRQEERARIARRLSRIGNEMMASDEKDHQNMGGLLLLESRRLEEPDHD